MCGDKKAFFELDESFRNTVKFGDNSIVLVLGKGRVTIQTKGNSTHTISSVLFVPDLKTKLFSVSKLLEKGYELSVKDGICRIQDIEMGLIAQVNMIANRMFPLYLQNTTHSCFSMKLKDVSWLWHFRYGHLNFGGLKTLKQKNTGLPQIEVSAEVCEECVVSKQHQDPFPTGKSWRAKRPLELDKSEAFIAFRSYKVQVEKEIGSSIKVLCIDRGEEYISREFETFCENNEIKRQLTAAYTLQQNGVCERKNRTLLNMKSHTCCTKYDSGGSMEQIEAEVFDEENFWQWNKKVVEKQVSTNFDGINDEESQKQAKRDQLDSTDGPVNPPSLSTTSDNKERPQRTRRKPAWMTDYEVTGIDESNDPLTYFALFSDCDPTVFEKAIKDPKWQRAMDEEIEAIE
ncbi:Retrovirus-related Pol polyprotein from transposon TNT 1-94 [Cucumis melo var. makuwa]|uniref:Retrovirus-related Pol polyprotein from transposon TNT 1-94 n=1 Tax=Cucumis melo var. makuwa TaxID=1194695 RepID=A0A5D3CA86_CUCMM|nr:Retrovirus-related Pol polyprotein from transposon TNT 1-94 [Cucumis melo var. makuwa]TYK07236.1 Retrovirus-related Pol polyprotein from transposon TNT 1-94 [Cucumis melo var. makuwa]